MRSSTRSYKPFSKLDLWLDKRISLWSGWISGIGGVILGEGVGQVIHSHYWFAALLIATGAMIITLCFRSIIVHWRMFEERFRG